MSAFLAIVTIVGLWVFTIIHVEDAKSEETWLDKLHRYRGVLGMSALTFILAGASYAAHSYDARHPVVCVKSHPVHREVTECWSIPLLYSHCEPVKTDETVCDEKEQR